LLKEHKRLDYCLVVPIFFVTLHRQTIKTYKIMARKYKTENGRRLKAIRSYYDGRVIGWIDVTPKKQ
jgi:hypothetical protein